MSYASRLVAMSRGDVPRSPPRVIGGAAESPHEEHVEIEARVPGARAAGEPPRPAPRIRAESAAQPVPPPTAVPSPDEAPNPERATARDVVAPPERETVERHTIVEAPAAPPARTLPLPATPLVEFEHVVMPPPARWLAEDPAAHDPLVESASTDELRELMRSVRAWTSSPPTPLPSATPPPARPDAPASAAHVALEPTQVSIGNVLITVEDAPTTQGRKREATPRTPSDRLARNYIRGG